MKPCSSGRSKTATTEDATSKADRKSLTEMEIATRSDTPLVKPLYQSAYLNSDRLLAAQSSHGGIGCKAR
jgi:hypothetical protein